MSATERPFLARWVATDVPTIPAPKTMISVRATPTSAVATGHRTPLRWRAGQKDPAIRKAEPAPQLWGRGAHPYLCSFWPQSRPEWNFVMGLGGRDALRRRCVQQLRLHLDQLLEQILAEHVRGSGSRGIVRCAAAVRRA